MARQKTSGKSAAKKSKPVVRGKTNGRPPLLAKKAAATRKGPPAKSPVKAPARSATLKAEPAKKVAMANNKKPVPVAKQMAAAKAAPKAVAPPKVTAPKPIATPKGTAPKAVTQPANLAGMRPMLPKAVALKQAMAAAARPAAPAGARTMPALNKQAVQKISGPAQKIPAPATPKAIAEKAAQARQQQAVPAAPAVPKKPVSQRHGFKTNEWIVYPAHGVGRIVGIEEQEIAGISLELFVITFEKDKMTLRVPTGKSQSVGMRKLAEENTVKRAMETLKGKARIKRTMWSRRAQEYEAKINSGDLISIAEVVRDLYRSESQPEQSYSERQLYEAALDRMAREIAAVDKLDERGAVQRITEVLSKSAKGRRAAAEEAEIKAA